MSRPAARPRLFALLAAASAAVAGCGESPKVQRSSTPVTPTGANAPVGSSTSGASGGPAASGHFTGADVPNRYGDVQVEITVAHGRITDVTGLRLPSDRARSRYISQQASPILRSEVLAAQSAQIDLVSGATYTSDGWASSVASALSQVR